MPFDGRDDICEAEIGPAAVRSEIDWRIDQDRSRHGADAAICGTCPVAEGSEIVWYIDQDFQAGRHAKAKPGIGTIQDGRAIAMADVDAVLALEAAFGHNKAGIGNVGPVGGDFA